MWEPPPACRAHWLSRGGCYAQSPSGRSCSTLQPQPRAGWPRQHRPDGAPSRARARSHFRFALPLTHLIPGLLRDSVPLFLKRQCDRALGRAGFRRLRVRRRADTRRGCRTVRTLRILSWMHIFYCRKCLKVGLVIHFFGREHTVPTF